jgi:hypothetical protein
MKSCGVSLIFLVLGAIVAIWLLFHIGTIVSGLDSLLHLVTGK